MWFDEVHQDLNMEFVTQCDDSCQCNSFIDANYNNREIQSIYPHSLKKHPIFSLNLRTKLEMYSSLENIAIKHAKKLVRPILTFEAQNHSCGKAHVPGNMGIWRRATIVDIQDNWELYKEKIADPKPDDIYFVKMMDSRTGSVAGKNKAYEIKPEENDALCASMMVNDKAGIFFLLKYFLFI